MINGGGVIASIKHTSISTSTFCVNNTLWDTLTIEMCQQIDQVEILKQERASVTNSLEGLWVLDGASIGSGIEWLLGVLESRGWLIVGNHFEYY